MKIQSFGLFLKKVKAQKSKETDKHLTFRMYEILLGDHRVNKLLLITKKCKNWRIFNESYM